MATILTGNKWEDLANIFINQKTFRAGIRECVKYYRNNKFLKEYL